MRYLSVCSGIEAATVAWHPLGWEPAAFSEIEAFPRAVLRRHYPDVPLHGRDREKKESMEDYAKVAGFQHIERNQYGKIDLLVGGTPCQSFSIAGLRGGLADGRGNLALEFMRLADRERPRWIVWENVPGVLSSHGGRDFGSILGALGELGYGFAHRILDAQHFGVPQRRRRVFVVGYLGDWRRAAAVLFERHSLQGNPAPRREAGQDLTAGARPSAANSSNEGPVGVDYTNCIFSGDISGTIEAAQAKGNRGLGVMVASTGDISHCLNAGGMGRQNGAELVDQLVAHSLRGEGFDASEDGTGRGTPLVVGALACNTGPNGHDAGNFACNQAVDAGHLIAFDTTQITSTANYSNPKPGDSCHPLAAGAHAPAICFTAKDHGADAMEDCSPTLRAGGFTGSHANGGVMPAVAFSTSGYGAQVDEIAGTMQASYDRLSNQVYGAITQSAVRRLTPRECERLQGFPDDYTNIPWRGKSQCPDGPRYKALGNSMAVPVMRWIGERIQMIEMLS